MHAWQEQLSMYDGDWAFMFNEYRKSLISIFSFRYLGAKKTSHNMSLVRIFEISSTFYLIFCTFLIFLRKVDSVKKST